MGKLLAKADRTSEGKDCIRDEEMLYGIQARGSVRLSEVARSLSEKTSVKERIDRLSRNLGRSGPADEIGEAVLVQGASRIGKNTLQTFLESKHLAGEKDLDRLRPDTLEAVG